MPSERGNHTGQPSLSQLSDGRLQVAAQHTDGDIRAVSQTASGSATWQAWTKFGGSMASEPVAAKLGNGVNVQFAVDTDGQLWAFAQTGAVPFWRNLGDRNLAGPVTVVSMRDGVRIFGVDGQGAVAAIDYFNDGAVSPWASLGGTGLQGPVAAVVRPGYAVQVFGVRPTARSRRESRTAPGGPRWARS